MADTFYPDIQDEPDNSINNESAVGWVNARNAASGTVRTRTDNIMYLQARFDGGYNSIDRVFINFDTSSIPDTNTIITASLYVWVTANSQVDTPSFRLYDSTASDSLVSEDYDQMGSTLLSDTYMTNPSTGAYFEFPLNTAGIAYISKTGITKFCIREYTYDGLGIQPTGSNLVTLANSNTLGTTNDPKLVITYLTGGPKIFTFI